MVAAQCVGLEMLLLVVSSRQEAAAVLVLHLKQGAEPGAVLHGARHVLCGMHPLLMLPLASVQAWHRSMCSGGCECSFSSQRRTCAAVLLLLAVLTAPTLAGPAAAELTCEMSMPTHMWPDSVRASPLRPEPHPMSSSMRGVPSSGRARSSTARCVSRDWISIMRLLLVYFLASSSL
jgi:hypothetical protein